jgi:biofilm PGA synthesis N-glycosyltransferase PgaC
MLRSQTCRSRLHAQFGAALAASAVWTGFSLWVALPWIAELSTVLGSVTAWIVITGVALLPGCMNAFQVVNLLFARQEPPGIEPSSYPPITVLIAAFNEAANIGDTLRSIAVQRYPGGIEAIVVDDGSTDGTAAEVRATGFSWLRLIVLPRNCGKSMALNNGLALAQHELVVTLDADSWLHADALRLLVRRYLQGAPGLRAVAGAVFVSDAQGSWAARLQYWDYFHGIAAAKRVQSTYGGTLVAQGAFSLFERSALQEAGGWKQCVGEDIVMTWALLKHGWTVDYAENALCFTRVPDTLARLSRQRERWARGMIEALRHHPGILVQRRLATFLASWNLVFPWIDLSFTFAFIPGVILALFGVYWLVGPVTLALIPSALLLGMVMYRCSNRVFTANGLEARRDLTALLCYTLCYGFIMHPASLRGYAAELLGVRKSWGTK